ncbi:MAG: MarR family winged helix-turn-helix transcriptional regulator [Chloroflexota bacterium]|nr:MarR family winged helix-turn-helix transcriptional regulator [Chloroflexota bacterium]
MPPDPFDSVYDTPSESPGFLLWQVTNRWQRRQRAVLREINLTHVQFVLLAALTWLTYQGAEMSGVSQVRLAQHAQVDVMMTSQVVRVLAEKGLMERTPHPRDTRANLVQVTSQGQDLARRAIRLVEHVDQEFFAALDGDIALFTRELQALLRADEPAAGDS